MLFGKKERPASLQFENLLLNLFLKTLNMKTLLIPSSFLILIVSSLLFWANPAQAQIQRNRQIIPGTKLPSASTKFIKPKILKTGYLRLPLRTNISEITYEVRNGLAIFEDDIVLGPVEEIERKSAINKPQFLETPRGKMIPQQHRKPGSIKQDKNTDPSDVLFSVTTNNANYLWPGGVVYYEIKDGEFPSETLYEINSAINTYNTQTNITFKLRDKEKNYIRKTLNL